jgi:hypothetical protein
MPLDVEGVVDRRLRLKETPSGAQTLDSLHFAPAPSNDEMRILSPVVVAQPNSAESRSVGNGAVSRKLAPMGSPGTPTFWTLAETS